MGKGGGGAPQPASQTVNQSNLPEYARPYFEDIMTRGTTASNTEYQPYTGQRVADFSPMQQQAFQGIQNLGTSPLLQPAAGLTGAAGLGGLGAGQQYTQQATSPGAMQSYMSPYMQNVVDWQKTQAINDYGRQLPGQQAAATRAGAFGGSRQAIVESEAQRNLQNQLGGIQAQGTQAAFDQANKNLQFGSQLGLQGLGLAGQMGQQFGQLGQTAFGQQAAAAQAQQQAGAIQQAQTQQELDKQYESFMQQKYYPQEQLQFLSSLLRGSVVAPQQTQYTYQAQPSMVSQLGGLGLGALGMSRAFGAKEGGAVPGYADGGITGGGEATQGVTPSRVTNVKKQLLSGMDPRKISDPLGVMLALQDRDFVKQLQLAAGAKNQQAIDRGVPQGTVMDEMGLGNMDAGVMGDPVMAASGGIIAFNQGGDKGEERTETTAGRWWRGLMDSNEAKAAYAAQQERYKRELEAAKATPGLFEPLTANQRQTREEQAAGLLALAQPQTRVPSTVGEPEPTVYAQQKPPVSPDTQQAPAARPSITPGQAIKPAEDELMKFNKIEKLDPAAREAEYRKAMADKFPSELRERLDEYKSQAAQAREERDADRWLAVAMGGFAAAAGQSPYALQNFAQGLGLTTKEMATINKDFRKAEELRNKAIREERRADRQEQMGMEDKALQTRQMAEKYNLDVEKANQSLQAHLEQTKAFREATASRERTSMAQARDSAETRKLMAAGQLDARREAAQLRARGELEKSKPFVQLGLDIEEKHGQLARAKGDKAKQLNAELEAMYKRRDDLYDDAMQRVLGPQNSGTPSGPGGALVPNPSGGFIYQPRK